MQLTRLPETLYKIKINYKKNIYLTNRDEVRATLKDYRSKYPEKTFTVVAFKPQYEFEANSI